MSNIPKPFWVVWCRNGWTPTVRHPTPERAQEEAERLARKHPGREFWVLTAVGVARKVDVEFLSVPDVPM